MKMFILVLASAILAGCASDNAFVGAFKGYPNPDAVLDGKCFVPGDFVYSANGRTCVGLGYPPVGFVRIK